MDTTRTDVRGQGGNSVVKTLRAMRKAILVNNVAQSKRCLAPKGFITILLTHTAGGCPQPVKANETGDQSHLVGLSQKNCEIDTTCVGERQSGGYRGKPREGRGTKTMAKKRTQSQDTMQQNPTQMKSHITRTARLNTTCHHWPLQHHTRQSPPSSYSF